MLLTRSLETHPFLSVGPLTLDVRGFALIGPTGRVALERCIYVVLKVLFQRLGMVVPVDDLVAASWPDPDFQPEAADRAVRMRVLRARSAIRKVGVPEQMLRSVREEGYLLDGTPRVVRAYTPQQAAALDRLLATHPDRDMVAELAA